MRMNSPELRDADVDTGNGVDTARRSLFAIAVGAPLLLLGLGSRAFAQAAPACINETSLPAAQKSMRRSLGFKAVSADPNKKCGNCSFFSAPQGECGKCALLSGGIVGAVSVCDSWAKKA